ncbi:MAG: VCBS repeat-containing protein, partial [Solirubrobacteraceae bacterium]
MSTLFRRPLRALALAVSLFAVHTSVAHADIAFTRSDVPNANGVTSVALGDLDGKNGPDLVTVESGGLVVRLNNGNGTFGAPSTIPTTNGNSSCVPYQVQIADVVGGLANLGGDGANDLVLACYSGVYKGTSAGGVLARIPGTGQGTFGDILVSGIGTASSPLMGESRFALAEWRESGPPVVVFPMEGYDYSSGTFHVFCWSYDWVKTDCSNTRMARLSPIVAGEADGGDFDEVLTMSPTGELQTFGIDTGAVGPPRLQSWGTVSSGVGTRWSTIMVGDLQHDGRPDVVTTSSSVSDGFVNTILGVPGMLSYSANPYTSTARLVGGALLDADGDGVLDFVGALNNGTVIVQRGTTAGSLFAPDTVPGTGFPGDPNSGVAPTASADLDGNGTTDFVAATPGASTIEVLLNGALGNGGG